jgi:hypothetical protein
VDHFVRFWSHAEPSSEHMRSYGPGMVIEPVDCVLIIDHIAPLDAAEQGMVMIVVVF